MGVQIIGDQHDFLRVWIHNIGGMSKHMRKITRRAGFANNRIAFARQWLENHENISDAIAFVLGEC